ncbi:MAG: hypothetical protein J6B34_01555 [Clostridia bacterium]|nr:hypothetical protein [Clostridia bacterium]
MAFTRKKENEEKIRRIAKQIFANDGDKYSPDYIERHNAEIKPENDKLGVIVRKYKKWGFIALIAFVVLKIVETLASNIVFATQASYDAVTVVNVIFGIPITISALGIFLWAIIWICDWLLPNCHCTACQGFFSTERVFEKHLSNMDSSFVESRVEKREIKNTKGATIGTIDENVNVQVNKMVYYTVFRCKKCNTLMADIIVKQYETRK